MTTTTFAELKSWGACEGGYRKLAKSLGGIRKYGKDTPITLLQILDSNGFSDTFWVLERIALTSAQERDLRLLACDYAEAVLPIWEAKYPDDKCPADAIAVARKYAEGKATQSELAAARDAAGAATWAAWDAAGAASWATAWDAAGAASWAVARDAAWAAWDAAGAKQTEQLRAVLITWSER